MTNIKKKIKKLEEENTSLGIKLMLSYLENEELKIIIKNYENTTECNHTMGKVNE